MIKPAGILQNWQGGDLRRLGCEGRLRLCSRIQELNRLSRGPAPEMLEKFPRIFVPVGKVFKTDPWSNVAGCMIPKSGRVLPFGFAGGVFWESAL